MTRKEALKEFISFGVNHYGDYWSMQESWAMFVDGLVKSGRANEKRTCMWDNPTTPEKFKAWVKRNG